MNKIFGKPLGFLFIKEHKTAQELPEFLESTLGFIYQYGAKNVGIFRVSGSVKQTEALKQQFEEASGTSYKPLMPNTDPNAIASLLKMYLRDLPQPLIEGRLYSSIMSLFESEEMPQRERVIELRQLIRSMSERNITVLERLMALCNYVVKMKDLNKMTDENISLVLGPNLMWPQGSSDSTEVDSSNDEESKLAFSQAHSLKDTPTICNAVSTLIVNYSQIFENDSPYDPDLKGTRNLPRDQLWVKKVAPTLASPRHMATQSAFSQPSLGVPTGNKQSNYPVSMNQATMQKLFAGTLSGNSSGSDSESNRKGRTTSNASAGGSKNFRGHMPRGIVEKLSVGADMIYPLRLIRLTGESLICMTVRENSATNEIKFLIDREIPFDHIKKVETVSQLKSKGTEDEENDEDGASQKKLASSTSTTQPSGVVSGVKVIYQQKGGYNSSIIVTQDTGVVENDLSLYHYAEFPTLEEWNEELSIVLKRYDGFVNLAKNDPDRWGAVLTKKEFKLAKQAKLEQQKKLEEGRKLALDHPVDEILTTTEGIVHNNIISINKLSYQQMINQISQMREKLNSEQKTRKLLEYRLVELETQNKEYIEEVRSYRRRTSKLSDNRTSSRRLTSQKPRFKPPSSESGAEESEYDSESDDSTYDSDSDDSVEFRVSNP